VRHVGISGAMTWARRSRSGLRSSLGRFLLRYGSPPSSMQAWRQSARRSQECVRHAGVFGCGGNDGRGQDAIEHGKVLVEVWLASLFDAGLAAISPAFPGVRAPRRRVRLRRERWSRSGCDRAWEGSCRGMVCLPLRCRLGGNQPGMSGARTWARWTWLRRALSSTSLRPARLVRRERWSRSGCDRAWESSCRGRACLPLR
jgi:hypothetical protein